jgi:hypothetical protein
MKDYPVTDSISGRPAGALPNIRTIGRKSERKNVQPRVIIVVPHGDPAPPKTVLYCSTHRMIADLTRPDLAHTVDIYRGRASGLEELPGAILASSITKMPVTEKERAIVRGDEPLPDDLLDDIVRVQRGDLSDIPYLLNSPWWMSRENAEDAAILSMSTEHLYAGIREEHGRWQYYRGLGSHLVVEGTTDTKEEAEMLARACLIHAWLERLMEIKSARGGVLDWGWPIPSPYWREIGDPQSENRKHFATR